MRIAVIGAGAREHAIAWALQKNTQDEVWTLPGNAGCSRSVPIDVDDFASIENFCKEKKIDLIIVGQEKSLALGIQNILGQKGYCVFGPSREAARLESSKIWSKEFMKRNQVQTAPFFIAKNEAEAEVVIKEWKGDCVIKWDGLAAGKGVAVCLNESEAALALSEFHSKFSSTEFVIEKRLEGRELSLFVITNGDQYCLLAPAKDYKRIYDGDKGPNTGGMGAVSADSLLSDNLKKRIEEEIIKPTLNGLKKENIPYMGFLYFGLMICEEGPYLLEYNVRLGDPETSAVLPRLQTPLLDLITACLEKSLDRIEVKIRKEPCVNVVLASEGYPSSYKAGLSIEGLQALPEEALIFHAGTAVKDKTLLSSGGRILNCGALGASLKEAQMKAYEFCSHIKISSSFYRRDIGEDCLEEENRHSDFRKR